jgi:hypothetical protein
MTERALTFDVMKSAAEAHAEILEAAGVAYLHGKRGAKILADQEASWKLVDQQAARQLVDEETARKLAETFAEAEEQALEEAKTQQQEAAWEEVPTRHNTGKNKEENQARLQKWPPSAQTSYYDVLLREKKKAEAIEKGEDDFRALLSGDGTASAH